MLLLLLNPSLVTPPVSGTAASIVTRGYGSYGRMQGLAKRGYSSYIGLPEPPVAGKQYTVGAEPGGGWDFQSIGWGQTPAIVTGDIAITPLFTPSGYPVTCPADAILSYISGGDPSRQLIVYDWYDVSALGFLGQGTFAINDQAPLATDIELVFAFPLGIPITPVDLAAYIPDPEGDVVTVTNVDALPTGYTLNSSQLGGTPSVQGIQTVRFQGTDPYTATSNLLSVILITGKVQVPDVDDLGSLRDSAEAEIASAYLNAFAIVVSDSLPFNQVISQSPAPGTLVDPFTTVTIIVSLGDVVPGPSEVSVLVRAFQNGFFGGLYRYRDDTFYLSTPEQYSPYWMEFIDTPPVDWTPQLEVFDAYIDREMLEFGIPVDVEP